MTMDSWYYWDNILGSPKFVLAPMVDHSELPWRMLSREYGCHLAYTPMFHAANFATSKKYRNKQFTTCKEDRPLIVQFCANDPDILYNAASHVVDLCDGVDINLGCPQEIARRGHYGAFIQDDWDLISSMVAKLRNNLNENLGVSCKIRRLETVERTIEYAQMLERAGCTFLGIHARTREQRGCRTGLADWNYIKAVRESVRIPVIANGNVQSLEDAENCLAATGAAAVMTAEGNLYNPGLFLAKHYPAWFFARKYLDYVKLYEVPSGMAKSHLFKLFHRCIAIEDNVQLRSNLGESRCLDDLYAVIDKFEEKYNINHDQEGDLSIPINTLPVPPYFCQPHYRYESKPKVEAEISECETLDEGEKVGDISAHIGQKKIKLTL